MQGAAEVIGDIEGADIEGAIQAGGRQTVAKAGKVEAIDLDRRLAQPRPGKGRQSGLRRERGLAHHRAGIDRQGLQIAAERRLDRLRLIAHDSLEQRMRGHRIGPGVADRAVHREHPKVAMHTELVDRVDAPVVMQARCEVGQHGWLAA